VWFIYVEYYRMDKYHMALAEICFAINYRPSLTVWEHTFTPKEYLTAHLESRFSRWCLSVINLLLVPYISWFAGSLVSYHIASHNAWRCGCNWWWRGARFNDVSFATGPWCRWRSTRKQTKSPNPPNFCRKSKRICLFCRLLRITFTWVRIYFSVCRQSL